jgi:hypothetical protein
MQVLEFDFSACMDLFFARRKTVRTVAHQMAAAIFFLEILH